MHRICTPHGPLLQSFSGSDVRPRQNNLGAHRDLFLFEHAKMLLHGQLRDEGLLSPHAEPFFQPTESATENNINASNANQWDSELNAWTKFNNHCKSEASQNNSDANSTNRDTTTNSANKISNKTPGKSESKITTQTWKTPRHKTRKTIEKENSKEKEHQNPCEILSQEDEDEQEDNTLSTSVPMKQKEMKPQSNLEQYDVDAITMETLEALLSETHEELLTTENQCIEKDYELRATQSHAMQLEDERDEVLLYNNESSESSKDDESEKSEETIEDMRVEKEEDETDGEKDEDRNEEEMQEEEDEENHGEVDEEYHELIAQCMEAKMTEHENEHQKEEEEVFMDDSDYESETDDDEEEDEMWKEYLKGDALVQEIRKKFRGRNDEID